MHFAFLDLIERGGFMMGPLLLAGLVALAVIIERVVVLRFRWNSDPSLALEAAREIRNHVSHETISSRLSDFRSPQASVLRAGLELKCHTSSEIADVEFAMQTQAEAWMPALESRLDILDTIVTAAPLMGLLGTITGMMSAFKALSAGNGADPSSVTGGIAEALISTATGLLIALAALFAYNYLNFVLRSHIFAMENAGARLVEALRQSMRHSGALDQQRAQQPKDERS